jgi:hypothetical protein
MKNAKLTRAIAITLAGSALYLGAVSSASAHVMYNTMNAGAAPGAGGTDGWSENGLWVGSSGWCPTCGQGSLPGGGVTPFGTISPITNWAVEFSSVGEAQVVSSQNAYDQYGVYADIDTAKGAWNDAGPNGPSNSGGSQGWAHNTDVGLFKSDVTQQVTLTATSLHANSGGWNNFGISVFTGMDAGTYDHHSGWNINYRPASNANPNLAPAMQNNPLFSTGLTFLTYTDNSTVTFTAQAGQIYSILLGGYSGAGNFGPHDSYLLDINASPVPVPAAIWLFGGGLASLAGVTRRKRISPA